MPLIWAFKHVKHRSKLGVPYSNDAYLDSKESESTHRMFVEPANGGQVFIEKTCSHPYYNLGLQTSQVGEDLPQVL